MFLKEDIHNQVWVWVDEQTQKEISPHFDYEEDALLWKQRLEDSEHK